jgi:hypothetical protein
MYYNIYVNEKQNHLQEREEIQMKNFFKKCDEFEDNHPFICGCIKFVCFIILMIEVLIICLAVKYAM